MYFTFIICAISATVAAYNITTDPIRTSSNLDIAGIDYIAIDVLDYWD